MTKISFGKKIFRRTFFTAFFACAVFMFFGCDGFFAQKPAELQTKKYLNELRQVKENPNVKNPLPELYRAPAKRLKLNGGVKIFYFAQNNTVKDLMTLLTKQMGVKVDTNASTNQLVIQCKDDAQADQTLEFLEQVDVPPIQVNIDCIIIERFADVTTDWEAQLEIDNFLGEEVTMSGLMPGASLRESKRTTFGVDVGYWRNKGIDGHEFRAVVDALISRGYLKVLMNPSVETLNGQKAKISTRDNVPIEKIATSKGVDPYSLTEYQWVEDSLEVTPHVYADGSIGLATNIKLGSRSKPEGVVQVSIITERSIQIAENRLAPGDSMVIGGLRKTEERAVIRGIPFFKDIPIFGILFSSKDFEEKTNEVIFILTPSISGGGRDHAEVMEEAREKLRPPDYDFSIEELLTDPLGMGAYTQNVEAEASKAKFERFKSELEKAEAQGEVEEVKAKLLEAAEKVLQEKQKASQATTQAQTALKQAQKAQAESEKSKTEAAAAKAEAEKAKAAAETAKKQAAQQQKQATAAKSEAQKALSEAEKAKAEAERAKAEAEKARSETQKIAQEKVRIEKAKLEVEQKLKDEAEKRKQQEQTDAESSDAGKADTPAESAASTDSAEKPAGEQPPAVAKQDSAESSEETAK